MLRHLAAPARRSQLTTIAKIHRPPKSTPWVESGACLEPQVVTKPKDRLVELLRMASVEVVDGPREIDANCHTNDCAISSCGCTWASYAVVLGSAMEFG